MDETRVPNATHHRDNPLLGPLSRADFITANYPLVKAVARRFRSALEDARIPMDDAISEGAIGLILAYDRYNDPSREFKRFAYKYIRGHVRNVFRRSTDSVRIPRRMYPIVKRLYACGLADERPEIVAEELGISVADAKEAIYCARVRLSTAMTDAVDRGADDDHTALYTDAFLARLKPKPRAIIERLMALDTPSEVAQDFGMTRQAVYIVTKRVRENYEQYAKISA